jgi:hypothetical protein
MIYLTAIGLPPGGSSTVHIYTQTVHRTTKKQKIHRTKQTSSTLHRKLKYFPSTRASFIEAVNVTQIN